MNERQNIDELLLRIERLTKENARLKEILSANGINYEQRTVPNVDTASQQSPTPDKPVALTKEQILQQRKDLFRSLFKGREDVFALRWTSKNGKTGYSPACQNFRTSLCDKKRNKKIKCIECPNRQFIPLGDAEIQKHLIGKVGNYPYIIGIYAMLSDDTCNFLCTDFDDKNCEHGYQKDVLAFVGVCKDWGIPYSIERSRSGNGAHVWILFEQPVLAVQARRLGNAILTEAMNRDGRVSFKSYDRFFPNQDHLPEGGLGNLVALPLQGLPRKKGNSVFVYENFQQYPDQWEYLRSVRKLTSESLESLLNVHTKSKSEFGELSKTSESKPWETPAPMTISQVSLPSDITVVKSNMLYIPTKQLPSKVVNHLKRIASFKNPEFGARLGMHLSTYNIPRIISCADVTDDWLALPRGCEDVLSEFFEGNTVSVEIDDKTNHGYPIDVSFKGTLRQEQEESVNQLMAYDNGILSGTTAFGKTVAAIGLIAKRKVNTLVLVHNKALAKQWRERFDEFLKINYILEEETNKRGRKKKRPLVGILSSDENTLNGNIDIALLQSCISDGEVKPFVRDYGMVIVDECHHVSASNFEQVLKFVNAKYVYGLTATPMRKDGHQPIIFMQCGPIRFTEDAAAQMARQNFQRVLIPRFTTFRSLSEDLNYNKLLHELTDDKQRNELIVSDVANVLKEGRTPIVISRLVEHVMLLADLIKPLCKNVVVLIGSTSAKERKETEKQLQSIPQAEPLVIVASLSYISEGYDMPRLDTLFLAQPVSYKGVVTQYTGRLHRNYEGKTEVRVYDYVDIRIPMCDTMYKKRLRGYASVGYKAQIHKPEPNQNPDIIYNGSEFEQSFISDMDNAKHSIVIACPIIRIYRHPVIIQNLLEQQTNGVSVYVYITKEGYDEQKFREFGGNFTVNDSLKIQCAIIDKSLCWYGDINFLGYHAADNTVMRIEDANIAGELLDIVLDNQK